MHTHTQTKFLLLLLLTFVAGTLAFAPARPAFSSTALFNEKADWGEAAELGWSMGGEDYTRSVEVKKDPDDKRKDIHEAPSFEEYMKQRAAGGQ